MVVTRVGDVPSMVEENINGFVTPDKDDKALAEKLSVLLTDPEQRQAMGRQSRNMLLKNFTINKMVDQIENIYGQLR